jgi:hypothetical protein
MSFIALLLLIGIGSLVLTLPYLPQAAETEYGLVRTVAWPLLNLFVLFLISKACPAIIFEHGDRVGIPFPQEE